MVFFFYAIGQRLQAVAFSTRLCHDPQIAKRSWISIYAAKNIQIRRASSPFTTLRIKGRVERVGLPLYLIWVNGIVFFGGFGGFAFFNTLTQDTQHDDIWVFAGKFIAGLFAMIAFVFHLKGMIGRKIPMLVVDETTVEISADGHVFNFGMLDYIFWDQDYRALATPRGQSKKIDTNLIILISLN